MATHPWATLLKLAARGELFHVVDVETTGLSAETDRVIELATVTVRDGAIVDRFETLVNPGIPVSRTSTRITGIQTPMLQGAPTSEAALGRWLNYLGGTGQFVAHNAQFDWNFLRAECARAGLEFPFKRKFCTMKLAGHFMPYGGRFKLEHLARRFGVEPTGSHRAMADAEAAAGIFLTLLDHLQSGTSPAPRTAREEAPFDPSGDPWQAVLRFLKPRSLVTAAVLEQHAALAGREEGGTVVVQVSGEHFQYFDAQPSLRGLIEEAVRQVFGPEARLRLEVRPGP